MAFKVRDYSDAELEFRRWLQDKFPKTRKVNFKKVAKVSEDWVLEGELIVEKNIFKDVNKLFKVMMNSNGEIITYEIIDLEKQKS